jgi:hypothetical protein
MAVSSIGQQTATYAAQQEATRLYPELAIAGSPFNQRFLNAVEEAKSANDPILLQPSWPLTLAKRVAEAEPQYAVVIQDETNLRLSNGGGWMLETGEAFPFIRWLSATEFQGGIVDPNDRTYALLRMDDKTLVVPSRRIRLVDPSGLAAAAMTYGQIVNESRKLSAFTQEKAFPRHGQPAATSEPTLAQMQQILELYTKLQQLNNTQDQQFVDMIQQLQGLKAGRSRPQGKQTPAEANAWWQQYQQQQKQSQMQAEIDRLRQDQRR